MLALDILPDAAALGGDQSRGRRGAGGGRTRCDDHPGGFSAAADAPSFDFARTFDAVTCLFSSIAYVLTEERLDATLAAMARHLKPGGTLVLEPWISPENWIAGRPHLLTVDEPDLKIARMSATSQEGEISILEFDYLVGTPEGTRHFAERHEAALFTDDQYRQAFERAALMVDFDDHGLTGRGLYLGRPA